MDVAGSSGLPAPWPYRPLAPEVKVDELLHGG